MLLGISRSKGIEANVIKDSFSVTFAHLRGEYAKGDSRGRMDDYSFYPEIHIFKHTHFECFLL